MRIFCVGAIARGVRRIAMLSYAAGWACATVESTFRSQVISLAACVACAGSGGWVRTRPRVPSCCHRRNSPYTVCQCPVLRGHVPLQRTDLPPALDAVSELPAAPFRRTTLLACGSGAAVPVQPTCLQVEPARHP